jgi:hypothetical protein
MMILSAFDQAVLGADMGKERQIAPLAMRREPDPRIRRNLTPRQTTGERSANHIPLELVAVSRCHIQSP